MSDCDHRLIGGSSKKMELCPTCQKEHLVYREGSWDWEPVVCDPCKKTEIDAMLLAKPLTGLVE